MQLELTATALVTDSRANMLRSRKLENLNLMTVLSFLAEETSATNKSTH